jgi:hypothetical protein
LDGSRIEATEKYDFRLFPKSPALNHAPISRHPLACRQISDRGLTGAESKDDNTFADCLQPAGRNLAEMNSLPTFRVVGICANGKRVVISKHASHEAAERVVNLIQFGSQYSTIVIESDGDPDSVPAVDVRA